MRGSPFYRRNDIFILRQQARGISVRREAPSRRFDVSAAGLHGISVVSRFDGSDGCICLEVRIPFTQDTLQKLGHEFIWPE